MASKDSLMQGGVLSQSKALVPPPSIASPWLVVNARTSGENLGSIAGVFGFTAREDTVRGRVHSSRRVYLPQLPGIQREAAGPSRACTRCGVEDCSDWECARKLGGGKGRGNVKVVGIFSLSLSLSFSQSANAAGIWGGGGGGGGEGGGGKAQRQGPLLVTLASYAVSKFAYEKITRLFSKFWLEKTGQVVRFRLSIAGSGSQARAVIDGLPADIVSLALPLDVLMIEKAGLIRPGWRDRVPNNAVPAETTVCIVTRPENRKGITDWEDLGRNDVSVITANPKTAGVARWNFLALWGSVTIPGGSEEEAREFLQNVFRNVPVEPRDAREASDVFFKQGLGDAMITYENEIFLTNQKIVQAARSEALPFTIPKTNVRVETVIAVVDTNADKNGVREVCEAFVEFCFTEAAQLEFAKSGFRPYLDSVGEAFGFQQIEKHWRVEEELGDWLSLQDKFFADNALVDSIEKHVSKLRKAA